MPRRRSSRNNNNNNAAGAAAGAGQERSVASHVRDRQRAVAEREASRLARPEQRPQPTLGHADRKKSAVSSTPAGVLVKQDKNINYDTKAWCGPFSVARQMIQQREEAKRQREAELEAEEQEGGNNLLVHPLDEAMEELDQDRKRKSHPSLSWKSHPRISSMSSSDDGNGENNSNNNNNNNIYAKRQKRAEVLRTKARGGGSGAVVPSLFSTCVKFLVDNFDCVESLGYGIDNTVRTSIVNQLVAENKLNGPSFETLVTPENGIEALELIDCSQISQDIMSSHLKRLLPNGLRYLVLDQAGCCFGPKTVTSIVETVELQQQKNHNNDNTIELFALSVGGAYLLKDIDTGKLIRAISNTVSSLEFKACPMVGIEFSKALSESYGGGGDSADAAAAADDSNPTTEKKKTKKLLELSLEDLPALNEQALEIMTSKPDALKNLKSLSLRRIDGLTDSLVVKFLECAGPNLEQLDLSDNHNLTDETLAGIRRYCSGGNLRSLNLSGLRHLTPQGLEALFMHVPGMDARPPSLRILNLGKCDHEAVTDELIDLITQASTRASTSSGGGSNKANNNIDQLEFQGGLVRLDVQGSVALTDTALECLASTCSKSLESINLSFCPKVSDNGLGYLVDNCSDKLEKVEIWGCAQVSDLFLDGHRRANDPDIEIAGAWIKKSPYTS